LSTPSSSGNTGQIIVCPTSHLDWDWLDTFAEYFEIGPPASSGADIPYVSGAKTVLTGVCQLLRPPTAFCFSLAEVAYLQAYLAAYPDDLATLVSAGPGRFAVMGGGLTSPDNLLCHGEVFIRNYLLGRRWLASVGLDANVVPVAWLPDDFGHDPQLPVVLAAMGLRWLGLSRVPGSPQPFPNHPIGGGPSVADQLANEGLVFSWIASDGSQVLAHFMPATYGAVWDVNPANIHGIAKFARHHATGWPVVDGQPSLFVPAGGDFALSEYDGTSWQTFLDQYNTPGRQATGPVAGFGTFAQFMARVAGAAGTPQSPLLVQNYWTGIFASRPALKTLHYRAAQLALAAEAAATLLRLTSTYSTSTLDDLDAAIEQAWQMLVPSSHHDYITGTSPDRVYWGEQLPMLEQAAQLAEQCLSQAAGLIAAGVTVDAADPVQSGDIPVVVFNPVGFARGGVVELPAQAVPGSVGTVTVPPATAQLKFQRTADRGLLFALPDDVPDVPDVLVDSFGYATVILRAGQEPPPPAPPPGPVTLDNGLVHAVIDPSQGWAITSLTCQGQQLLDGLGNSIRLYQDNGNIYQFGNEPLAQADKKKPIFGQFIDSNTSWTAGPGEWVEYGEVLQHYRATVTGTYNNQPVSYTLDYLLYYGEQALRMRLAGAAPAQTTVVTAFDLLAAVTAECGLTYGTAHHYDDHQPVPYWTGPTFRATHDFVQTTGTPGPQLAIYHQGVPAWSTALANPADAAQWQLLGALLRNTFGLDGMRRGASGTDPGVHTREYAVGLANPSGVATGEALRTALKVTNPLVAAVIDLNQPTHSELSLPQSAGLAAVTPAGILRAARTQAGSSTASVDGYYAERMSFILRVYVPDPASVRDGVTITLSNLPNPSAITGYDLNLQAMVVSALEEPLTPAPPVSVTPGTGSGSTISYTVKFTPDRALTTIQLTATRRPTQGDTGT